MSKFTETLIKGEDISDLQKEYEEQLTNRPLKRQHINKIVEENKLLVKRIEEIRELLKTSE